MRVNQLGFGISQSALEYLINNDIDQIDKLLTHVELGTFPGEKLDLATKQEILSLCEKIIDLLLKLVPYDELLKSTMDIDISIRSRHLLWRARVRTISELIKMNPEDLLSVVNPDRKLLREIYAFRNQLLCDYARYVQRDSTVALSESNQEQGNTLENLSRPKPNTAHSTISSNSAQLIDNTIPEAANDDNRRVSLAQTTPIEVIANRLNRRAYNILRQFRIDSIELLMDQTDDQLLSLPGLGATQLEEINKLRSELEAEFQTHPIDLPINTGAASELSYTIDQLPLSQITVDYLQARGIWTKADLAKLDLSNLSSAVSVTPLSHIKDMVNIRTYNAIHRHRVRSVEDLFNMSDDELLQIRNFGAAALDEIRVIRDDFSMPDNHVPEIVYEELKHLLSHRHDIDEQKSTYDLVQTFASECNIQLPDHNFVTSTGISPLSWKYLLTQGYSWDNIEAFGDCLRSRENLPMLQDLPATSIIQHDTLHFLLSIGCPLHRISAHELVTVVDHALLIRKQKFNSVLDVFLTSADRHTSLTDFIENTQFYADWLGKQRNWDDEINDKQPSPLSVFCLRHLSSHEISQMLFGELSQRSMQLMPMRYGLDGGEPKTLQEIADVMGLTRERVRQITQRDMNKVGNAFRSSPILSALAHLAKQFIDANKILNEFDLISQLASYVNTDDLGFFRNLMRFILYEVSDFRIGDLFSDHIWVSTQLPTGIAQKVIANSVDFLARKMAPMRLPDIRQHLLGNLDLPEGFILSTDFLITCLNAEPQIEAVDSEFWGLTRWQKKTHDDIVMALRELGKPSHFTEIARLANERLSDQEQITAHSVHAQLGRYTNLFVRTDSGTFGLREWNPNAPIQPPKYVDLIEKVLEESGLPLTVSEVYERVDKMRPAKLSSISMYLGTHERFAQYGQKYGLARWQSREDSQDVSTEEWLENLKNDVFGDLWEGEK